MFNMNAYKLTQISVPAGAQQHRTAAQPDEANPRDTRPRLTGTIHMTRTLHKTSLDERGKHHLTAGTLFPPQETVPSGGLGATRAGKIPFVPEERRLEEGRWIPATLRVLPVHSGDRAASKTELVVSDVAPAPVTLWRLQVALHAVLDLNALGKQV